VSVPLDHHTVIHDSSPSPTADKPTTRPSKQLPMVGWYQPSQLIRTGIAVLISTIFGRHSDHRLVEALGTNTLQTYDYTCDYHQDAQGRCEPDRSQPRQELWFDYVGDVGDGWHSTYAIAYALAQEKLRITKGTNGGHYDITLPRGALLSSAATRSIRLRAGKPMSSAWSDPTPRPCARPRHRPPPISLRFPAIMIGTIASPRSSACSRPGAGSAVGARGKAGAISP
jgi:hypothetical protein